MTEKCKCIMIKTQDNKKLFTSKGNFNEIIEFVKTFRAEIYLVQTSTSNLLSLEQLSGKLCSSSKSKEREHLILEKIYPLDIKRSRVLNKAKIIRNHVEESFLEGKIVSLKSLKNKFYDSKLSDSCLCNHLSRVRKELKRKGYKVNKIGKGKYRLE